MTTEENYLVAFLDILGFKSLIDSYIDGDTSILEKLRTALSNAESNLDRRIETAEETGYDSRIKIKQFSDCTSISFKHLSIQDVKDNPNRFGHELATSLLVLRDF